MGRSSTFRRAASPSRRCSPPPFASCTRPTRTAASWRRYCRRSRRGMPGSIASGRSTASSRCCIRGIGRQRAPLRPSSARLDIEGVEAPRRSDRSQVDASERPTDLEYRRCRPRRCAARARLPSPVADRRAVRLRRSATQCDPCGRRGRSRVPSGRDRSRRLACRGCGRSLAGCALVNWDEAAGAYRERDLHGAVGITDTVADLFPLYAGVPDERQARRLATNTSASPDRFGAGPDAPWAIPTVARSSSCVRAAELLARPGLDQRQLVLRAWSRALRARRRSTCAP